MKNLTTESTDAELMEAFESLRRQACGEGIGSKDQTPAQAVESEGWTRIRTIYQATNCPGTPVLAQDPADGLWVVDDIYGPWAIQVAE